MPFRIYALRDVTGTVRSLALQTSSIMSKKIAERPDSLVLDVKFGKGSFNSNIEESIELAKSMIQTGELCGIQTTAFITRMDSVLGYTVGNWLEVRECIEIMRMGESDLSTTLCWQRSSDLIEVTLALAGQMLVQGGKATTINQGIIMSKENLFNGKAWKRFKEMVRIQGGDLTCVEKYPDAKYSVSYADISMRHLFTISQSSENPSSLTFAVDCSQRRRCILINLVGSSQSTLWRSGS